MTWQKAAWRALGEQQRVTHQADKEADSDLAERRPSSTEGIASRALVITVSTHWRSETQSYKKHLTTLQIRIKCHCYKIQVAGSCLDSLVLLESVELGAT